MRNDCQCRRAGRVKMRKVKIQRFQSDDQGTLGYVSVDGRHFCKSIELPWRNNERSYSCIPDGIYKVKIRKSKKYGKIYWVLEVENRSWILIHSGNFAGDSKKGWIAHSEGCILFGKYFARHLKHKGQQMVCMSRTTVRRFMQYMRDELFELEVKTLKSQEEH